MVTIVPLCLAYLCNYNWRNLVFKGDNKLKRMDMQLSKKIYILVIICLIFSIFCTFGFIYEKKQLNEAKEVYLEMQDDIPSIDSGDEIQKKLVMTKTEESKKVENIQLGQKEWFLERKAKFPDMVGWLTCKDTKINYPVMQGGDNDFYLSHLPDGSKNKLGSIFLDSGSNKDFSSSISVIYGHMVKSGEMFGSLSGYRNQSYYESYPELTLDTEEGKKSIQILAAYLVDGGKESYPTGFESRENWETYMKKVQSNSFIKSKVKANPDDKLVIFSTCAYDFNDARLAVMGRIVS